jgi:hypothetical protein
MLWGDIRPHCKSFYHSSRGADLVPRSTEPLKNLQREVKLYNLNPV